MKKITLIFIFTLTSVVIPVASIAQSLGCDSYPYLPGENTIEFDGNGKFKLISTGAASVDFDDSSEVMGARREAELIAKRAIAEYINQKFKSEDSISSEINKSKTNLKAADGSTISTAQRDEVKTQLTSISARADALLKGVLAIGSCYTKGHEVRVTVGLKSETLAHATELEKTMGASATANYGKQSDKTSNSNNSTDKTNESSNNDAVASSTRSYDGSNQLKKF